MNGDALQKIPVKFSEGCRERCDGEKEESCHKKTTLNATLNRGFKGIHTN